MCSPCEPPDQWLSLFAVFGLESDSGLQMLMRPGFELDPETCRSQTGPPHCANHQVLLSWTYWSWQVLFNSHHKRNIHRSIWSKSSAKKVNSSNVLKQNIVTLLFVHIVFVQARKPTHTQRKWIITRTLKYMGWTFIWTVIRRKKNNWKKHLMCFQWELFFSVTETTGAVTWAKLYAN